MDIGDITVDTPQMDRMLITRLAIIWRRFLCLNKVFHDLLSCVDSFAEYHRLPTLEKLLKNNFERRFLTEDITQHKFWKEQHEPLNEECRSISSKFGIIR